MEGMAMIGLGRMGANMVRRLRKAGLTVAVYNRHAEVAHSLAAETGAVAAETLTALAQSLERPRIVWLMLPAGPPTQAHLDELIPLLAPGDVIVNGANAYYRDSIAQADKAAARGIHYVDAGVSGGIWGLTEGYALMVGGAEEAVALAEPYLKALAPAPDKGWLHCGPVGSGHFVKMVHNGIEYGMMQALAEGFAILKSKDAFQLDLGAVAEMWRHGSVVRSWLLDLIADFLRKDQQLEDIAPVVADSGEGQWTVQEALAARVPAPVISLALQMRWTSQDRDDYAAKLLAMMRKGFGGHAVQTEEA